MNSEMRLTAMVSVRPGRPPLRAVLAAGVWAVTVLGCRDEDGPQAAQDPVVRDSAGIQVVENRGAGLWAQGDGWNLSDQPPLKIGSPGGDSGTALFRVTGAVRLRDGRIVAANGGTSELLLFSSTGEFLARKGGAGGGPGEFIPLIGSGSIIVLAQTAGDTLRAYDQVGGKVLVFSPGGVFVRSTPLREGPAGAPVSLAPGVGWLNDGGFVATTTSYGDDPGARPASEARLVRPRISLLRFGPDGILTDTVGTFPGDESYTSLRSNLDNTGTGSMRIGNSPVPFRRTFHAATSDTTVAVGVTDLPEVQLYGPGGALRRIVRWSSRPRPVDASQREAWIKAQGGRTPDAPFPGTMPAFENIKLDAEGRLWVEAYAAPGDAAGPSRWSVYDVQGHFLGEVALPEHFRPLEIGADYVLGLWKDDVDVEYVRLHALHAGPMPANDPRGPRKSP